MKREIRGIRKPVTADQESEALFQEMLKTMANKGKEAKEVARQQTFDEAIKQAFNEPDDGGY